MNRQQRRQTGINSSQESMINKIVEHNINIQKDAIEKKMFYSTLLTANCITALVLNSELGLGKVRINRILKRIKKQYECYRENLLDGVDIINWCEENGIEYKLDDLLKGGV